LNVSSALNKPGKLPIKVEKEAVIRGDLRLGNAGIMKLATSHGVWVGPVQRI
jgi:hypothetical protein